MKTEYRYCGRSREPRRKDVGAGGEAASGGQEVISANAPPSCLSLAASPPAPTSFLLGPRLRPQYRYSVFTEVFIREFSSHLYFIRPLSPTIEKSWRSDVRKRRPPPSTPSADTNSPLELLLSLSDSVMMSITTGEEIFSSLLGHLRLRTPPATCLHRFLSGIRSLRSCLPLMSLSFLL